MKTLPILIIIIIVFSKYISAQFEDDKNYWESNERKMSEFGSKDKTPKQPNFFSAHYDNLHHTGDVDKNLYFYDKKLNNGFEEANNIDLNTEAHKASDFTRTRRLELESKFIGSSGDNIENYGSILSGVQIESKEMQKKSSATDYNIFDAKPTVKDLIMTSIPITTTTTQKPPSDQIMKYNDITILILDENNKIHNKLTVPILNTSHIIIKAFYNNIISDLPTGSIASNERLHQLAKMTTELATTTKTAILGKSINAQALDKAVLLKITSTQIPNSAESNSIDSKVKNQGTFFHSSTHHNGIDVNDQYKPGVFHEPTNLGASNLKTNDNLTEHTSYITDNTMEKVTRVKSFSEQQTTTSSIFYNQKQIDGSAIIQSPVEDLHLKSSNESDNLEMSKSNTERDKSATTYSLNSQNSTSKSDHVDSTTGISASYFYPTKPPRQTNLKNYSISGAQDLHLSLKPAILEIIDNNDRNKIMSSKNQFVNVYVPTFEFTQEKNDSMQANNQHLNEGRISNSGNLELLRIDSHTKNEASRPTKNLVREIESSKPINKSRITTREGLGHSKINDILVSVGSKTTMPPATSSVTFKPYSSQFIDHTSSLARSLEEETNALIDILLGQQNKSIAANYDKFSSTATTGHNILGEKVE